MSVCYLAFDLDFSFMVEWTCKVFMISLNSLHLYLPGWWLLLVQSFILRCICQSDMCHLALTSFSRLSGHDKVFCLSKFLNDYKWEVIDIWYGSWSRVVHVSLLYGICPWPHFHGWVDMLCFYDQDWQEDFSATIHGRLMINGPTIHCKVYVPVRHVSHSLDLGYVTGFLLLWFTQSNHTGLSLCSTFPETKKRIIKQLLS